jgi:hypothetical protein
MKDCFLWILIGRYTSERFKSAQSTAQYKGSQTKISSDESEQKNHNDTIYKTIPSWDELWHVLLIHKLIRIYLTISSSVGTYSTEGLYDSSWCEWEKLMASYILNRTLTTIQKCPFQHYQIILIESEVIRSKQLPKRFLSKHEGHVMYLAN